MRIVGHKLYIVHGKLYIMWVGHKLYIVHGKLYIVHGELYIVHGKLYIKLRELHELPCTEYLISMAKFV